MEYSVNKLSKMSGVSARALRYYDEIGLLKLARVASSGYRIYGQSEVNALQQILFYRELEFSLEDINALLTEALTRQRRFRVISPRFNRNVSGWIYSYGMLSSPSPP